MKSVRRPVVALSAMLFLVVIQAIADPTGVLALVGWTGRSRTFEAGFWPLAPYLIFVPVLLGVVWWSALRAGDRYWTLVAGVVLAVLLAQAATCFFMTWDVAVAARAAGYVTAKAVPAALIVAAFTRWFGGRRPETAAPASIWPPALSVWFPAALFAASRRCSPASGGPAPSTLPACRRPGPTAASLSVIVAMLLIAVLPRCPALDARPGSRGAGRMARRPGCGRRGRAHPGRRRVCGRQRPAETCGH